MRILILLALFALSLPAHAEMPGYDGFEEAAQKGPSITGEGDGGEGDACVTLNAPTSSLGVSPQDVPGQGPVQLGEERAPNQKCPGSQGL